MVLQPYSSGATSRTVSANCHRWPATSSMVQSRSPYSRSVGGSSTRPVPTSTPELGTDVLDPHTDEVRHLIVLCWLCAAAFRAAASIRRPIAPIARAMAAWSTEQKSMAEV